MQTTTSTSRDAVPEGWPPPTPVELLRVSRGFWWFASIGLVLNAAAIAWLACEQRRANDSASERGATIIQLLGGR